jgi:hypothetical protein
MRTTLADVGAAQTTQTDTALSLVATMFLPLTFLAGVFGMNFNYKPPGHSEPRPGLGIGLLNDQFGALYFWYIVGLIVIVNLYFYELTGMNEMFTVHTARPYQSSNKYISYRESKFESRFYSNTHSGKKKRYIIYFVLLILWCFTPYTFPYLDGHKNVSV